VEDYIPINFAEAEWHIDVARGLKERHEFLRASLEACLGESWRITKITEEGISCYEAALASRTTPKPKYTLFEVVARFSIKACENGALEQIIDGRKVSIPRKRLRFTANLLSNGHLWITGGDLEVPTKKP
jgi:hypothetical protein